eukprot:TRINITY_DN44848_c0_g1_i1.p1 TRINITY_DN44848_c0_g1~~TRINITY_DN44848_c0_g1_i1.p1  ORF type:complete len:1169 (-),score=214.03 TRINITY_DN44848_c0_g1_i1:117-3623(-)
MMWTDFLDGRLPPLEPGSLLPGVLSDMWRREEAGDIAGVQEAERGNGKDASDEKDGGDSSTLPNGQPLRGSPAIGTPGDSAYSDDGAGSSDENDSTELRVREEDDRDSVSRSLSKKSETPSAVAAAEGPPVSTPSSHRLQVPAWSRWRRKMPDAVPAAEDEVPKRGLLRRRLVNTFRHHQESASASASWAPSASSSWAPPGSGFLSDGATPPADWPLLGSEEKDGHLLHRGVLLRVKGWWRKGPKVAHCIAEIRANPTGQGFSLLRCRFTREGTLDLPTLRKVSLAGLAAEAIDMPGHGDLFCFRLYLLPDVDATEARGAFREEPLDFAATAEDERTQWLDVLRRATEHGLEVGTPVMGHLQLTVVEATLSNQEQERLNSSHGFPELFCIVRYAGMEFRTAPKKPTWPPVEPPNFEIDAPASASFGRAVEFPVADDDPDSLVTLETWVFSGRKGYLPHGRIRVPLYTFSRNQLRELSLPLRDPTLRGKAADVEEVGRISLAGYFQQPFESLVLPRPTPLQMRAKTWQSVGERTLREQFRELDAFLQDFEIFSSRFMHHCDTWRDLSILGRRVLQWDEPVITFLFLVFTTLLFGFYYDYILPLLALAFLCFTAWHHPWCRAARNSWAQRLKQRREAWSERFGSVKEKWCRRYRASFRGEEADLPSDTASEKDGLPEQRLSTASTRQSSVDADAAAPPVLERYENERRWWLGKFSATSNLRPWDPPPWCGSDGERMDPPKTVENGVHYVWRVEVNQYTDSDGWRYARHFGRGAVWRGSFQPAHSFVRIRCHVGKPAAVSSSRPGNQPRLSSMSATAPPRLSTCSMTSAPPPAAPPSGLFANGHPAGVSGIDASFSSVASLNLLQPSSSGQVAKALGVTVPSMSPTSCFAAAASVPLRSRSAAGLQAGLRPAFPGAAAFRGVSPLGENQNMTTEKAPKAGPEFGIAKTPFHDIYQQCLMRWAFLQRNMEYWMDWYERRKNLLTGVTSHTQTFAVTGAVALFVVTLFVPARWLAIAWVWAFFLDGLALGQLMRKNQHDFIDCFKKAALGHWLKTDDELVMKTMAERVETWSTRTSLEEVTEDGVQVLAIRDWIRETFYEGRPMIPLRAVQRCGTLGDLAVQVIWTSDKFARKKQRKRVWYRSTMRNLLDHVPSDITHFQPCVYRGSPKDSSH